MKQKRNILLSLFLCFALTGLNSCAEKKSAVPKAVDCKKINNKIKYASYPVKAPKYRKICIDT